MSNGQGDTPPDECDDHRARLSRAAHRSRLCKPGAPDFAPRGCGKPAWREAIPEKTYKIVDVVGVSDQSIHQAVRNALTKASQTLRNIDWFEVKQVRGAMQKNAEIEFQVDVRIGFRLEGSPVN